MEAEGDAALGSERGQAVLSDDALLLIFSMLPPVALHHASAVCPRWRYVAQADTLWRPIVLRTFGPQSREVGNSSGGAGWKALYHSLVSEALPVQAALKGKTILLLGDPGVGKTAYADRFLQPEAQAEESSEKGRSKKRRTAVFKGSGKHVLNLPTNHGPITITLWDQPTSTRDVGNDMRYELLGGGHAAIIMFDITSRQSYRNVALSHRDMMRVHEHPPMVLVGTKVDQHYQRTVQPKNVMFHRKVGMDYHEICALANHNWAKPLESLFKAFTGKDVRIRMEEVTLQEPQVCLGAEFFACIDQPRPTPSAVSNLYRAFLFAEGNNRML